MGELCISDFYITGVVSGHRKLQPYVHNGDVSGYRVTIGYKNLREVS